MFMAILNRTAWHPVGRRIAGLMSSVYKPLSRGSVELDPARPDGEPRVRFNLLDDPLDAARMIAGAKLAVDLLSDQALRGLASHAFTPTNAALMRTLNRRGPVSFGMSLAADRLLGLRALRPSLLALVGVDIQALMSEPAAFAEFVLQRSVPTGHVVGACRMGRIDDPMAVVDSRCRVLGLSNLRVVDGSIFPTLMAANTNIPITMAAEKAADMIAEDFHAAA